MVFYGPSRHFFSFYSMYIIYDYVFFFNVQWQKINHYHYHYTTTAYANYYWLLTTLQPSLNRKNFKVWFTDLFGIVHSC